MTLYIFRAKYFLAKQSKFAASFLLERPEFPLTLIAFLFYFFYTEYLNSPISTIIAITTSLINFLLFAWGRKKIQARLRQKDIILLPEIGASILLLALSLGMDSNTKLLIQIEVFVFSALLLSFSFKKVGFFYTVFTGILIFSSVFFSYRLIILQEKMILWALYRSQREASIDTGTWKKEKSLLSRRVEKSYSLRLDEGKLIVTVPNGLWFHKGKSSGYDPGFPIIGEPLCYVSASKQDPYALPVIGIYLKTFPFGEKKTSQDRESFFAEMQGLGKRTLGYRKKRGEIYGVHYEGRYQIAWQNKQTKGNELREAKGKKGILETVSYSYQKGDGGVRLYLHLAVSQTQANRALAPALRKEDRSQKEHRMRSNPILVYVLSERMRSSNQPPEQAMIERKRKKSKTSYRSTSEPKARLISPKLLDLLGGIYFISNRK